MCGVAVIFNYKPLTVSVSESELLVMRDHMLSRGPDDAGLWIDHAGQIGLAHRRLAIIDLSEAGRQPMATDDDKVRIVFNGEIYNYLELRKTLIDKGYKFRSQCDTEVLLYLYKEHGQAMVNLLRGMFAFVIWDQERQGIFMSRDHFGIKPLYYADNGQTIRIASTVKALIKASSKHIDTSIEPAGQVGFFIWGHVPEPYTIYHGVRALPAGTSLWIDAKNGCAAPQRFFNITTTLINSCNSQVTMTREEKQESLRRELLDSMAHHLIADVPVGVFLSSGLDSATTLALSGEIANNPFIAFTLGFKEYKGTENDETILASQISEYYGVRHNLQLVQKEDFSHCLEHIFNVMDQPTIDGVNNYFVCKGAHDAGIKVALSGLGGDELFGGYPTFYELPRLVNSLSRFSNIPWFGKSMRYISAPLLKHFTSPKYAGLFEYGSSLSGAYLLRRGLFMPWELPEFLDPELVRRGWSELQTISYLEETTAGIEDQRLQISALETSWYMKNQLLRDNDWASMAHSLELRVPLVDIKLFENITRMVGSGLVVNKQDMASTPKRKLPDAVLNRKKTGFSTPIRQWLLGNNVRRNSNQDRGLRGWAREVFINSCYR